MREKWIVPEGWEARAQVSLLAPAKVLAGLTAKPSVAQPRPSLVVEEGPSPAEDMDALTRKISDLITAMRGSLIERGTMRFDDGSAGEVLTFRFPVDAQRTAVQRSVLRLERGRLTTFIATVDATQMSAMPTLDRLIASYVA